MLRDCFYLIEFEAYGVSRRLPSLYSDFSQQRAVNPDGFAANVSAWQDVLQKATRAGLVPSNSEKSEILSIGIGEELLQSLESEKWGRPLALDTVIVSMAFFFLRVSSKVFDN